MERKLFCGYTIKIKKDDDNCATYKPGIYDWFVTREAASDEFLRYFDICKTDILEIDNFVDERELSSKSGFFRCEINKTTYSIVCMSIIEEGVTTNE